MLFVPSLVGRFFAFAANASAFAYLRVALANDVEAVCASKPSLEIEYRTWSSGIGWAVLGIVLFLCLVVCAFVGLDLIGIAVPD
jgi:hypothetical protein